MRFKFLLFLTLFVLVFATATASALVVYSSTNRLTVKVNNSNPSLVKSVLPGDLAPVYQFELQNYAPKGGAAMSFKLLEFGYRSSDVKRDELSEIEVRFSSPDFQKSVMLTVNPGDQYFSVPLYDQPILLLENEKMSITIYAGVRKNSQMAGSGEKFFFYLTDFGAGEVGTEVIIKANTVKGSQSNLITIK